jgi:hypothetical protein
MVTMPFKNTKPYEYRKDPITGRELKFVGGTPPFNKLHPTDFEMDAYFGEYEEEL